VKIKFLYSKGRKKRLDSNLEMPTEFFYGYKELKNLKYEVFIYEEEELGMRYKNNLLGIFLHKISFFSLGIPLKMIYGFLKSKNYKKFKSNDILIATTNGIGLTLAFANKIGLIKSKIVFIAMGLIPSNNCFIKKNIYKYFLENIILVTISKNEEDFLRKIMPNHNITYIPFGIDNSFWVNNEIKLKEDYIFAIGNDKARDWKTLIDAWESNFPNLKIVTSEDIRNKKDNISLIKGDWRNNLISDEKIRSLYNNAKFVIIPLKETIQPSGQSSCLQAMSCGKAVLMTRIIGLWDPIKLKHKENIYLFEPNSPRNLNIAIKELLANKKLEEYIAYKGNKLVNQNYTSILMAREWTILFDKISMNKELKLN
tara:strand:+ start:26947 stop:28053 length:1107 start_codon:yes stop_codon:yes gene_type:complete